MESTGKIISFVKRILSQWPSKGTLKIYALGSTLAMLGVVGGLKCHKIHRNIVMLGKKLFLKSFHKQSRYLQESNF
uniref:Uncharacterized protein n=1 Tax=Mola mola TaxID=94237 RepID=A0A3Q4BCC7_MOLML